MESFTAKEKELLEFIDELLYSNFFGKKVKDVLRETKNAIFIKNEFQKKNEQLNEQLILLLKTHIGQPIYWAHPDWRMETHTITGVEYRIVDTDFFDKKGIKYKGKQCICINVDEDGYYLADFIGKTLFFNKEEAIRHSRKEGD